MFEKVFRKQSVHPEGITSIETVPRPMSPDVMLSMPEISEQEGDQGNTKVAKIAVPPVSLYQQLVYKLDILIPVKKVEQEIVIPPGSYLQRVIYGKFKKLRVIKDPRHGLPKCLVDPKEDIDTYRVFVENGDQKIQMVDPGSPFIRKWDNFTLLLLLFTASVTPFETAYVLL